MSKGTLYQDQALTNVAVAYKNTSLIAPLVLPSVPVMKQSGKVYKMGKDAFRIVSDVRAPGAVSNRVKSYSVSTDTYYCDCHALNDVVTKEDMENADAAIVPETATTEGLVSKQSLIREKALADSLFNTATFSGYTAAPTNKWDDYTLSDPLADAETAIESVRQKSGAKANTLILGASVFSKLRRHPDIIDYFKYTSVPVVTEQMIAEAMGVDRVLVGRAVYNSNKEGAAESMTDVWGKYALFAYIASTPQLREPSLGYSYRFMTGTQGFQVYREELTPSKGHGVFIEVENYFDDIVHGADFGYLWSAVIG